MSDMTEDRLAEIESDYAGNDRIRDLCAALREAWVVRDDLKHCAEVSMRDAWKEVREARAEMDHALGSGLTQVREDRDEWMRRAVSAREERDKFQALALAAEAACAVMRGALERIPIVRAIPGLYGTFSGYECPACGARSGIMVHDGADVSEPCRDGCHVAMVERALSSDSGKRLLEWVRAAVAILERIPDGVLSAADGDGILEWPREVGISK